MGAEPRPGGDDRHVDRDGRQPASSTPPADLADERRAGDAPRRPSVGREEAPEVAQGGRPEQRVGDRVEDDVAVGVTGKPGRAGDLDAAEAQRPARAERVAVVADPGPGRAAPGERCGRASEVGRGASP